MPPTAAPSATDAPTAGAPGSGAFESSPVGFGAGTTGGAGDPTVKITSLSQLIDEAASDGAKISRLSTVLKGSDKDQVVASSNKTIVGVGANAAKPCEPPVIARQNRGGRPSSFC